MKKQSQHAEERRDDGAEPEVLPAEPAGDEVAQTQQLIGERDEALANWKRAQADYQNLRRRLQGDIDAAVQRSKQSLLQELLLVVDYLEMALAAPLATEEAKNLAAGVEMTRTALLRALEREGVKPLAETGAFDPAFHEAVESIPADDGPPGRILATLRRGYTAGGHVLRPAQVRVAAAPARTEDEDETDAR
jgi:molecular chaperone GrpE